MTAAPNRVSLGALALLLCLALPAGLLSLFAQSTTGEQVDGADLIVAGRVASLQGIADPESTAVELAVSDVLFGTGHLRSLNVSVTGRAPVQVGDTVVALVTRRPAALLGVLQMRKNPRSLEWEIVSPVTGMLAQGLSDGGAANPIPLALFQQAVGLRKGVAPRAQHRGNGPAAEGAGIEPDVYEPNDTLATATNLTGLAPPSLLTGNPTLVTGLTLTPNDVDFFAFQVGALQVLHAETLSVTGLPAPDTLMGLFDSPAGNLLAHDDDGGEGNLSQLTVPIETTGTYAVAIESAPDLNLDFKGDEGTTTGHYNLALELEFGSYVWNQLDLIMGVSPDGTLIEDFIGFKEIGAQDLLNVGVPADAWAADFQAHLPSGLTHVYGGGGDQLTDPGFVNPLLPLSFKLASFEDGAGVNRRGQSDAASVLAFLPTGAPRGLEADFHYEMSVASKTLVGKIDLHSTPPINLKHLLFTRVTDVDLFGVGVDEFFWSFNPTSNMQAFAVDAATNVGNVVAPAQPFGNAAGDLQAAVVIKADTLAAGQSLLATTAFSYTKGFATDMLALNECVRLLRDVGIDTWVVAVDKDPVTGLYAAFGTGLGD
ncbi:MAG TPA: hypothetical protein VFY71_14515 [Planctomycetota bacterium]|nr:hypothetical protein [Planctomycetota bacterium]